MYALRDADNLKHRLNMLAEAANESQRKLLATTVGVTWPPVIFFFHDLVCESAKKNDFSSLNLVALFDAATAVALR